MIGKAELLDYSKIISLDPSIVEKDYVLNWILAAIYQNPELKESWIFKGGTCLKKCYFETYRFSEDLDFTLLEANHIEESFLLNILKEISSWVYDEAGIELPTDRIGVDIFKNPRDVTSAQCKMGYIGPLQRRGSIPNIKFDLSYDEILVLEPIVRKLYHPYSDRIDLVMQASCYAYEEVFAEKIRALYQRARPRDLYDVIHMYRHNELISELSLLVSVLEDKCTFMDLVQPTYENIANHPQKGELAAEWKNMLKHQIAVLPQLDHYWNDLPDFFAWLFNEKTVMLESIAIKPGYERWSQGRLAEFTDSASFVDKIQFAAANRICINLVYTGKNSGKTRTVEPYSFRKSKEGHILFYGYEREEGSIKAFRLDRFQSVDITSEVYRPRFHIEISSTGPINMHRVKRRRR